jgi:UDP-galactopyranose mutase
VIESTPILVVGAGFAGAVHARELAEAGYRVQVIDRRDHIAGNAYDYVDANGARVHRHGPHLFHTNNETVVNWLRRFGTFRPYYHRVRALLSDGRLVPLPVNRQTIEAVYNRKFTSPDDVEAFLETVSEAISDPQNAAEYLYSRIGRLLTDTFFRPYTRKMWALDLEDIHVAVVKRLAIRYDSGDLYFPDDKFQLLPQDGYTSVFQRMFDHPGISVSLSVSFEREMENQYSYVFNSMPIDEYFEYRLGELPYRSIRFHHRYSEDAPPDVAVTNFTDDRPFTRETVWNSLPGHVIRPTGRVSVTTEEPCDYRDNGMERYYPVRTADDRFVDIYRRYKALAAENARITFIGRCGTYQYLDMDQVINQSLQQVRAWLRGKV